jgi:hypothetical protein
MADMPPATKLALVRANAFVRIPEVAFDRDPGIFLAFVAHLAFT